MKNFFSLTASLILFLISTQEISAQTTPDKEILANTLSQELSVSKGKITQVLSLISTTGQKMHAVAKDAKLTKDEKLARCKELGAERDAQIALLLTKDQIKKLEALAAAERSKNSTGQ